MIVTIDGPAGAGKSTVAKAVAARLGYVYLDTGALYRSVAWKALETGTDPGRAAGMKRLCEETAFKIVHLDQGGMAVSVDGRLLNTELRTPEVTRAAAQVAALPLVRESLLPIQQEFGRRTDIAGVVAEGRDLGTRIFPEADAKFFLQADTKERARRRQAELLSSGKAPDLAETHRDMMARDVRDQTRETAPLPVVAPVDATVIDTTYLRVEEVVDQMLTIIESKAADRR